MNVGPLDKNIDLDTGKCLSMTKKQADATLRRLGFYADVHPGQPPLDLTIDEWLLSRECHKVLQTPKPPPPPPYPPITHRIKEKLETSWGTIEYPSLWDSLVRFLYWLNRIMRTDSPKTKSKRSSQEMATMAELFEGYEPPANQRYAIAQEIQALKQELELLYGSPWNGNPDIAIRIDELKYKLKLLSTPFTWRDEQERREFMVLKSRPMETGTSRK